MSIFLSALSDLFSQGAPACPLINTSGASICQGSCAPLTANVVTNNQTTSYNVAAIPYAPYPFTGTQVLNGMDDLWAGVTPIGFNFCYFGTSYSQIVIGSNGEITFDVTQANAYNGWSITAALPNITDLPANTICGAFRDIDPSLGGSIYYQTVGSSPCRALVISWDQVPLFDAATTCSGFPNSTFQIVLYENTNYIDVYIQDSPSCTGWNSGYGEIGIQDAAGAVAVVPPARNFPGTWTATNEAWRFSPSGAPSYTVTWSDASGVVGTGLNFNACPGTTTTYTASMTLTNCNGSTLTVTDTAIVNVTPGTAVTVNSPTICAGASATITAVGGTTYTWSANAGGSNNASVTVTPASTTVYTVTTNAGGGGGCAPIAQSTVTVIPALTVTVNVPPVVCPGGSATLTANGAQNYTWTPATGLSAATGSVVIANPATTTAYTVTGSSGACPSASATTTVTIAPSISVNSPTICAGSNAILTATGAATYTWSANAGSATTSTVSVSPVVTTVYTVSTSGGGGGCPPTAQSTVTVVPSLSVTVNSPAGICSGATTTLTASGAATYSWSPGTGLSATTGSTVTANPNTTTTYTVTGSSGSCPSASAVTTVSVTPSATITVNSATICPTTSATLTANGSTTYSWSPATGLSATTGSVVTANPASTTVYTISGGNCVTSGTCTVTLTPACNITVNSATICPNATTTLTANGGGTYSWAPATGLSATTGASVTASPPSTTVYTVTSVSAGFTTTTTSTVVVNAVPNVTVNNATICQGATTALTVNGASTYTWTPATGLSATTASNVVASPTVTTTYTITGMAVNGCTNTAVATVGVNPMPSVSITPTDSAGCAPLCITFNAVSPNASINYSWSFGDGGSSISQNPTNCFQRQGPYTSTLTITDAIGCKATATATFTVYPVPNADFGESPQPVSILEPTIQFIDQSTNGPVTSWFWDFGVYGSGDTSHLKNPTYTYADTGYYTVHLFVKTAYGCIDSTTKVVKIDDDYELFVPTAFSPNGDGINETFLPITRGVLPSTYHMYVYDRWGNLVFKTSDLYKGWDGTYHGSVVMEDTFVWKIELKTTAGVKKQVHGQVSIVK